jgi:hypothetical protein
MDELCAVLHSKGCTVREVAITYVPLVPEEAPDPGASSGRVGAASTLPPPRGDTRRHDSAGTVHTSRLVFPSWRERPQERGAIPSGRRTTTKDALERRAERVTRRRDGRRAAALSGMGKAARAIARFQ